MRKVLILVALSALVTAGVAAAGVVGSKHDLTSATGTGTVALQATNTDRVCAFCHTPHQTAAANAQDPLWNHNLSAGQTYTLYGSVTFDATYVNNPFTSQALGAAPVTLLCLGCHDGTVGVGSLLNQPPLSSGVTVDNAATTIPGANTAYVGTDLSDDHPVNFTYDAALVALDAPAATPGLVTPASADWVDVANTVPLFGQTVQCASCHDPHNTTAGAEPFLVKSNAGSSLCTTCHIK